MDHQRGPESNDDTLATCLMQRGTKHAAGLSLSLSRGTNRARISWLSLFSVDSAARERKRESPGIIRRSPGAREWTSTTGTTSNCQMSFPRAGRAAHCPGPRAIQSSAFSSRLTLHYIYGRATVFPCSCSLLSCLSCAFRPLSILRRARAS